MEYAGSAVEALDMEARFTLCNMAVAFSAFTGIVAPDATTLEYVKGRSYARGMYDRPPSFYRRLVGAGNLR